jgi:hypothetical protein
MVGALQGNFDTGVQLNLRKHPNAYIAIKWNLNLLVITFFIMPFGPVIRIFYWPKIFVSGQPKLALISGTAITTAKINHQWNRYRNLNLLVITFLTTLTPLARVVLRNDASPSDGDDKRLVCVRWDQCHDHIADIWEKVD